MIYEGYYLRTIDEQQRVKLPDVWRGETGSNPHIITRGIKPCVMVYPPDQWAKMEAELAHLNSKSQKARSFYRVAMMWACDAESDSEGRIEIPSPLLEFASLQEDALIVGAADHVEIWDPGQFNRHLTQSRAAIQLWSRE